MGLMVQFSISLVLKIWACATFFVLQGSAGSVTPSSQQSMVPDNKGPLSMPIAPVQIAPPPKEILQTPPAVPPIVPEVPPSNLAVPPASPPRNLPIFSPPIHPTASEFAPSKLPGSSFNPVLSPPKLAPSPVTTKGLAPLLSPSTPSSFLPNNSAAPPINSQGVVPSLPLSASQINPPPDNPVMVPEAPVPVVPSFRKSPQISPAIHPVMPGSVPLSSQQSMAPDNKGPLSVPVVPGQIAPPPKGILQTPPTIQPIVTEVPPNSLAVPPASPPRNLQIFSPPIHPTAPEVAPSKLPVVLPPHKSVPAPETTKGLAPLLSPSTPTSFPPNNSAAPPINFRGIVPSLPPSASQINPQPDNPVMVPEAPVPVVPSFRKSPQISPAIHPVMSSSVPPSSGQSLVPDNKGPLSMPIAPVQIAPPPKEILQNPPAIQPIVPEVPPSILAVPPASPPWNLPIFSPPIHPTTPEVAPSTLPGSSFNPPVVLPPPKSVPPPETTKGLAPLLSPSTPTLLPPNNSAATPMNFQGIVPVLPPRASQKPPHMEDPVLVPEAPVPVIPPSRKSPQNSLPIHPVMPPSSQQGKAPDNKGPTSTPIAPVQIAPPPREILEKPPISQPTMPEVPLPSNLPVPAASTPRNLPKYSPPVHPTVPEVPPSILLVPSASPPSILPRYSPPVHPIAPAVPPSNLPEPDVSPVSTPPLSFNRKRDEKPVAAPPNGVPKRSPPLDHSPAETPMHNNPRDPDNAPTPLSLIRPPPQEGLDAPTPLPSTSFYRHHHVRKNITSPAPSSYLVPPTSTDKGPFSPPSHPPESNPKSKQKQHDPLVLNPVSPPHSPVSSSERPLSPASPRQALPPRQILKPFLSPKISPSGSSSPRNPKIPHLPPVQSLPPPPPNQECTPLSCPEPLTNTPPGSRCGCVLPIQVGLRLSVALYTFFPLVSELATEIAGGVFMKQSQVRIMGANAASQDPQKTIVLIDLVPLEEKFDNTTAFLTYQRFWHKQVVISQSFFGDYEVLYVRYPGLPASPPSASSIIDGEAYGSHDNNGRTIKPLGVDVRRRQHKEGLKGSVLAIIILSASVAVILCCAVAWVLFFRHRDHNSQPEQSSPAKLPSLAKSSGIAASMIGSGPSSVSLSYNSSIAPYTGTAKTFSSTEIERATDNFDPSRILGEGGFGLVFSGVLEDGTKVAVKVLKRDDQQGGREFLAEVEMLSRLHHRNLVKLIGICTEEHARCLVYELIPNGSVESHLHGVDKEDAPLDWGARLKIALGAARGLAYLHEDSSPRVIHRDFKSSNILLEHDFTPKVSDFGLARTALDEENRHISTRVMGTFGYVAPEYAMTGHLLVKSDVYSYGVVLLELLTGRKPVDMSQPPGQENVVNWARPLLTGQEGLELITDQSLGPDFPFDSISKVAAIASMCVQPEVSHRPFMGEVVQALKLVCNECEATKDLGSRSCSQEDISVDFDSRFNTNNSDHFQDPLQMDSPLSNYEPALDVERGLPVSELFGSARIGRTDSGSFRRHSSSGPLRRGRVPPLWQRMRRLSAGSLTDHGGILRLWPGSH